MVASVSTRKSFMLGTTPPTLSQNVLGPPKKWSIPATRQPATPTSINWSIPAVASLVSVFTPASAGLVPLDPISKSFFTSSHPNDPAFFKTVTPAGIVLRSNNSANYRLYRPGVVAGAVTNMVVCRINTLITSGALLFDVQNGGWDLGSIYLGDGTNPRFKARASAGAITATDSTNYTVGKVYVLVTVGDSNGVKLYVDGLLVATGLGTPSNLSLSREVAYRSPSATAGAVEYLLGATFKGTLPDVMIESLGKNPWQLFENPFRQVWTPV